jgi:hypothetical protein
MGFDGIENAQTNQKLPNVVPGRYTFKVDSIKMVKSRKGVTYLCLESTVAKRLSEQGNEAGSKCSLLMNTSLDNFLSNAKNLFGAVKGVPETKVTKQMADALVSEDNPGAGALVDVEASNITTRAGKPFTLVRFTPHGK